MEKEECEARIKELEGLLDTRIELENDLLEAIRLNTNTQSGEPVIFLQYISEELEAIK